MARIPTLSSARRSRHAAGGAGGAGRSTSFLARRRGELEARWRTTLDQVTALSVAYHEAAAAARPPDLAVRAAGPAAEARPASPGDRDVSRLARRVVAERQTLAEIEAALDRMAAGRYGRCEQCHRPVSAGVLTTQPEARFCSACSRHSARSVLGGRPATA